MSGDIQIEPLTEAPPASLKSSRKKNEINTSDIYLTPAQVCGDRKCPKLDTPIENLIALHGLQVKWVDTYWIIFEKNRPAHRGEHGHLFIGVDAELDEWVNLVKKLEDEG